MTTRIPLQIAPPHARTEPGAIADMPPLDAWLHRHQSTGAICMTIGLLAWFTGPPPTLPELRALAEDRWKPYERLCLAPGATTAPSAWPQWTTGPGFDPARHIVAAPDTTPDTLETLAAHLLAQPLGPAQPPWQLHLLPTADGFALLLRAHHALLDGKSLLTLMCALLDEQPTRPGTAARTIPAQSSAPPRMPLARALAEALPRARPLPFHGPVDTRRAVSWSRVSRDELGIARDSLASGRVSANAVFLTATAGALRTAGAMGRLSLLPGVCAMVPVDVRAAGEATVLGNHYATVRVPLPAHRRGARRLAAVDRFTRRALHRRARAQALLVSSRPHRYGLLSDVLGRYADSPLYSSLLCTSIATYAGPLALGPAPLTGLVGLPPLSPGHPLAVTMTLHDTEVTVTVVTDHQHRELAARLPLLIREEIRALRP